MDTAVVRQFLGFFQDFLHLCQSENWPNNNTSEDEIKNALLISQHMEKCLDKLHRKNLLNDFLSNVSSKENAPNNLLKICFSDPPKYILKKIINSQTKISVMDMAFKMFLEIFSEVKLEQCLADLMVQAASSETLLKNLSQEIPKEKVLEFKCELFLSELSYCDEPKETLMDMFNNCNQDTIDLIVISIINESYKYVKAVNTIVNLLIEVTKNRYHSHKKFWKLLFNVEEKYFIMMCIKHGNWFKIIVKALLDCGKLLKEHMSAEYFYIDLTYSHLVSCVRKICKNFNLQVEFFDIVRGCESDLSFWDNIIKES